MVASERSPRSGPISPPLRPLRPATLRSQRQTRRARFGPMSGIASLSVARLPFMHPAPDRQPLVPHAEFPVGADDAQLVSQPALIVAAGEVGAEMVAPTLLAPPSAGGDRGGGGGSAA